MTYVQNLAVVASIATTPGRRPRRWSQEAAWLLFLTLMAAPSGVMLAQSSEDEEFLDLTLPKSRGHERSLEENESSLDPSLTLAYAWGSGDSSPDSGVNRQFRQTRLHDTYGRFNGIQCFSYYGGTLDPELHNLGIMTTDVGLCPSQLSHSQLSHSQLSHSQLSSFDLIYHHYQQDVVTDDILEGALLRVPKNGESRGGGQAIDLVIGYRAFEDIRLRPRLDYFMPGDTFGNSASDAYSLVLGFEYTF